MDNLQHIDELLKSSASSFANSFDVDEKDWQAVEKKLRYRKNRIYAVWFFLALILVSSSIVLFKNIATTQNSVVQKTQPTYDVNSNQEKTALPGSNNTATKLSENDLSKPGALNLTPRSAKKTLPGIIQEAEILNSNLLINEKYNQIENSRKLTIAILAPKSRSLSEYALQNPSSYNFILPKGSFFLLSNLPTLSNNNKVDVAQGYGEVGASFTPSVSSKFVSENVNFAGLINRNYYKNAATSENAAFASSSGLNAQYHFPSGVFIATGLFMAQRSEFINYNYLITEYPVVNNNAIEQYVPLAQAAFINVKHKGSNSYHFVEIPLNLGYKQLISSKFELRGQLGMSYLRLFNLNGVKSDYTTLEIKNLTEYNFAQNNLAANAKLGVYLNKPRFTIGAEPIFNYNVTSLSNTNSAIKVKPYSYGFNISTNYKFKN